MMNPGVQVSKMQQIANDPPLFWKKEPTVKEKNSSSDNFTHVDVYPFVVRKCYDIGKADKKFKECKHHGQNNWLHGFLR